MSTRIESRESERLPGTGSSSRWLAPLILVAGGAVAAETLLLRVATRVLIHIPGVDVDSGPLAGLAALARTAFRMAVPLVLVALLAVMVWLAASGQRVTAYLVGGALAAVSGGWLSGGAPVFEAATVILVAVIGVTTVTRLDRMARIPVGAWMAAFLLIGMAQSSDQVVANGGRGISVAYLGAAAEALAVAALMSAPLLVGFRLRSGDWLAGAGVAGLAAVALMGAQGAATGKILLLWNLGLVGVLPTVFYALAIGGVATAVIALLREGRALDAAALVFMVAAGFGLFSSYQTTLMILGLVVINQQALPGLSSGAPSQPAAFYSS